MVIDQKVIDPHESVDSPEQEAWERVCGLLRERLIGVLTRRDLSPEDLWYIAHAVNLVLPNDQRAMTFDHRVEVLKAKGLFDE